MKKITTALFALFLGVAAFAQQTVKADKAHSKLGFSITHLGIADVTGLIKNFDVTIRAAKADFSDAAIELTADVNSIDTEVEMRDNHLRSADFFDVASFPSLAFKSTGIKKTGKNKYRLTGNLTMHGITKPVTMALWYRGTTINPMSKAATTGFQLTGKLKRSDFGIGPKFPAPMLSDEVSIRADGEFTK